MAQNKKRYGKSNATKRNILPYVLIALGILILLAITYFFFVPPSQKCDTRECFIASANDCVNAELTLAGDAGTFKYKSKDCVLTKTLVSLNEGESQELKDLLEGKSMTCTYDPQGFDEDLINTISLGMEFCTGDLREALENFVV